VRSSISRIRLAGSAIDPRQAQVGRLRPYWTLEGFAPITAMNAEEYHQLGEECRRNAEAAVNHDVKERWLRLSEGWEALAKSTDAARFK
jgi:hypothetical protein